jgi:hypothetical protein
MTRCICQAHPLGYNGEYSVREYLALREQVARGGGDPSIPRGHWSVTGEKEGAAGQLMASVHTASVKEDLNGDQRREENGQWYPPKVRRA